MIKMEFKMNNKVYTRVTKTKAIALVESGQTVFVVPCNVRLNTNWFSPCRLDKQLLDFMEETFEKYIHAFIYYNCNSEMGYYPSYYVVSADE